MTYTDSDVRAIVRAGRDGADQSPQADDGFVRRCARQRDETKLVISLLDPPTARARTDAASRDGNRSGPVGASNHTWRCRRRFVPPAGRVDEISHVHRRWDGPVRSADIPLRGDEPGSADWGRTEPATLLTER